MNNITKMSSVTYLDVVRYIRLDEDELDDKDKDLINKLIIISKNFICKYTGRTTDELDKYEDIVIVVLILCQDMWDNRALYVNSTNLNKVVESILDLYSVNLL